jgi:hypothetical protein
MRSSTSRRRRSQSRGAPDKLPKVFDRLGELRAVNEQRGLEVF